MFGALLTAFFFALTSVCANRSAKILGSARANLMRLCVATLILGIWAHIWGFGLKGGVLGVFFISGCVGFGLGGVSMFYALPRLGSNWSMLIVQCGSAVFAATIEWLWLGTHLTCRQILFAFTIFVGLIVALIEKNTLVSPRVWKSGIVWAVLSAFGQGFSAVISRKAFKQLALAHQAMDPATSAYQRVLGGLVIAVFAMFFVRYIAFFRKDEPVNLSFPRVTWKWVALNALFGPILGVTCYQWALKYAPSGVVLPIVSITPLLTAPLAYWLENSKPRLRYYIGACIAMAGTIGLITA